MEGSVMMKLVENAVGKDELIYPYVYVAVLGSQRNYFSIDVKKGFSKVEFLEYVEMFIKRIINTEELELLSDNAGLMYKCFRRGSHECDYDHYLVTVNVINLDLTEAEK